MVTWGQVWRFPMSAQDQRGEPRSLLTARGILELPATWPPGHLATWPPGHLAIRPAPWPGVISVVACLLGGWGRKVKVQGAMEGHNSTPSLECFDEFKLIGRPSLKPLLSLNMLPKYLCRDPCLWRWVHGGPYRPCMAGRSC